MAITLNGSTGITSPGGDTSTSLSTGLLTVTGSTVPANGMYLPTTNTLAWATNSTERMRLDASGNLGIGVTPSASWQSTRRVLQVGGSAALWATSGSAGSLFLSNNTYFDGANFRYLNTSGASYLAQSTDGSFSFNQAPSGTAGNAISFTQAMTLDASGKLGVGSTSPQFLVSASQNSGSGAPSVQVTPQFYAKGYAGAGQQYAGIGFAMYEHTNGYWGSGILARDDTGSYGSALAFYTSTGSATPTPTERARIDSSGNLLVGATSNSGVRLYVKGASATNADWSIYAVNSAGTTQFGLRNDNYLYAPSVGGYGTTGTTVVVNGNYLGYLSSSLRFKKDVVDYDKGLLEILSLRPVYYKSKNPNPDGEYDEQRYAGLIAEEIAELGFSEFVLNGPDGQINSIQYGNMVALCVKAIQELTARLEALEGAK